MFLDQTLIRLALEEDIGSGDVTTEGLVDPIQPGKAVMIAKEAFVLCGLSMARQVFALLDPETRFESNFSDGDKVDTGEQILRVSARLRSLLMGERTALNFLQRLSGISTLTRRFVDLVRGTGVRVTDTRKTTPGWRRLEKYAVRVGGGHNHRFGLYDGILIKDNHIKGCGGITAALERVRRNQGHLLRIEVEVTDLAEVEEALAGGADIIMLDNMDTETINNAVSLIQGRALVEVSGGVNLDSVVELAATGVDILSVGALTHSARAVDISMRITG